MKSTNPRFSDKEYWEAMCCMTDDKVELLETAILVFCREAEYLPDLLDDGSNEQMLVERLLAVERGRKVRSERA